MLTATHNNQASVDGEQYDKLYFAKHAPFEIIAQIDDIIVLQTHAYATDANLSALNHRDAAHMRQQQHASYGQFNLGLHVGDEPYYVHQHRAMLLQRLNHHLRQHVSQSGSLTHPTDSTDLTPYDKIPLKRLHWLEQVHGDKVCDVDTIGLNMQPVSADAMITCQPNIGLAMMTADCVPIVLYQPDCKKIAVIHAGWQGLACGIIKNTVAALSLNAKSTQPSAATMAWVGACISQPYYEVGDDLVDKLLAGCERLDLLNWQTLSQQDKKLASQSLPAQISQPAHANQSGLAESVASAGLHKYYLDLPKLAVLQLQACGVAVQNASVENTAAIACSYALNHFYSYRRQTHRQQPATGRMAMVVLRHA